SGSSPYLGLSPTTPQYAAGIRTEPPVSVPRARSHTPAATSAAEPPEDPPEVRDGSRGLRVSPISGCANPAAYSRHCVVANTSAPASRRRRTTTAATAAGRGAAGGAAEGGGPPGPGEEALAAAGAPGQRPGGGATGRADPGAARVERPAEPLQPFVGGQQAEVGRRARAPALLDGPD